MKLLILIALWSLCAAAAAQSVYKCKDAAGRITYSGSECQLIGQTSAGEVSDRTSVAPAAARPAAVPSPQRAGPHYAAPDSPPEPSQNAANAPADPEKRCFAVKTAKGFSTRCNDTPEEDAGGK